MEIKFLIDSIKNVNLLDFFFLIILVYSVIQCFLKGFSLSLISFMKWVLSTVVTIILVPKFQPLVAEYIESQFINNVGLSALIFIFTLFITILIGKTLSKVVTWTGVGSIDKVFGFLFGFFKGYIVSVCLFSIFNWLKARLLKNCAVMTFWPLLRKISTEDWSKNIATGISLGGKSPIGPV